MIVFLLIAVFTVSFLITGAIRRYALARQLMDIPNARSSHSVPTPRGGGVGFVVAFLLALPCVVWLGGVDARSALAVGIPGLLVAVLGFVDDHGHIAARWRLLGHFIASAIGLLLLNGLPPVEIAGYLLDLGWMGNVLAVFFLVWMLNLFNFMDGIDGLAASEAVFVLLGLAFLYGVTGSAAVWVPLALVLAASAFLIWNFPPAKIFMGDAGSGFLGITIAVMVLGAGWLNPQFLWSGLVLSAVFVTDSTVTLIRRLCQRERVFEAHCTHGYQRAARQYKSHMKVTVAVNAINILWLWPIAWWAAIEPAGGGTKAVVAYLPLIALALYFKAGARR